MRQANVQVAVRVKDAASIVGHLPASRAAIELSGGSAVVVNAEESSTTYYRRCLIKL